MEPPKRRNDLATDEAAQGVVVAGVAAELEALHAAVGLGLLAPDRQERADDSVVPAGSDSRRGPTRREAVEDGLDLVGRSVARGPQPALRHAPGRLVAELAELGLAAVRGRRVDDL